MWEMDIRRFCDKNMFCVFGSPVTLRGHFFFSIAPYCFAPVLSSTPFFFFLSPSSCLFGCALSIFFVSPCFVTRNRLHMCQSRSSCFAFSLSLKLFRYPSTKFFQIHLVFKLPVLGINVLFFQLLLTC
ncbi:MAG: hypothetical protein J3R72DRAFT_164592 [Linnemannia gamsii]|nr:MAG: hypothetical protein J3R72DRAFT_164592 [Linnemannia gamsii]